MESIFPTNRSLLLKFLVPDYRYKQEFSEWKKISNLDVNNVEKNHGSSFVS